MSDSAFPYGGGGRGGGVGEKKKKHCKKNVLGASKE